MICDMDSPPALFQCIHALCDFPYGVLIPCGSGMSICAKNAVSGCTIALKNGAEKRSPPTFLELRIILKIYQNSQSLSSLFWTCCWRRQIFANYNCPNYRPMVWSPLLRSRVMWSRVKANPALILGWKIPYWSVRATAIKIL